MSRGVRRRINLPEELRFKAERISKTDWMLLFRDAYLQLLGDEEAFTEEAWVADAEQRLRYLQGKP